MKKIVSILLICIITLFNFALAIEDDWSAPKVPKLEFANITEIPCVDAGEYLTLELTIQNETLNSARSVTITPEINDLPIEWEKPTDYTKIDAITRAKPKTIIYKFKIKDSAKSGTYGIKFNFAFQNSLENPFTSSQTVYFKIVKEKTKPVFVIDNITTTPETITPGQQVKISFDVTNIGSLDAKTAYVTLTNLSKDTFMPANSVDSKFVDTIPAGEKITVSYDLLTSENIAKGTGELQVKIDYTCGDEESSVTRNIYLNNVVSNNETPSNKEGGTPKIMISSYSTGKPSITAGDNFNFSFTFTNTNSVKTIRNIKITVSSNDGAFIIAKGSNTFFIESVAPKASVTRSIELIVKQDLASKSYPVNLEFDFEDSSDTQYSSNEVISLPVTEYSKLIINSVYVSEAYVGGNTNLSFDYVNMGRATVSNLTANVEGDYESVQSINYIGNLNAGTSDYYDIEVKPTKDGENYGVLVLSFEDSSGKIIQVKKEFQGYAMANQTFEDPPFGEFPMDPMYTEPQAEPISTWIIVVSGIGTFIVSFFITKFIAKKIFMKKLEDEI